MDIYPKIGERTFLLGKTGVGKTTVLLQLLRRFWGKNQIELIATKEDDKILSLPVPIVTSINEVANYKFPEYPMVVYYPQGSELKDPEILDSWCQWCYERKNTVAAIDEVSQVAKKVLPLEGFLNLYTRGRTQNVTVIAGTQRPRGVPPITYTEAENIYKFYLSDKKDRQRVAEFTHPLMEMQVPDLHGFHYYNPGRSTKVFYIRNLKT